MSREIILNHLLDRYEKSRHLLSPGISNRRVMLRVEHKELPEYDFEDAAIRNAYNEAARDLEKANVVRLDWVSDRPVLKNVILNLERVMECYEAAGRTHPAKRAAEVEELVTEQLRPVSTEWILAWKNAVCTATKESYSVPSNCKNGLVELQKLLTALREYDALHGESVTMRSFSSRCYQDTKLFEREVRESFLRVAVKYCPELTAISELEEFGAREQLAYLGIYTRPELYELSGKCRLVTANGSIDFSAAAPYGLALPSTTVDTIRYADLRDIRHVVFIENKTNYDAYLVSELRVDELAVYQGGFLSPQQKKLFRKLKEGMASDAEVCFWADIDLGGFRMFSQLQQIFPALKPMRMSASEVEKYHPFGLVRSEKYMERLRRAAEQDEFPVFEEAMKAILKYGVTIEQETFLN